MSWVFHGTGIYCLASIVEQMILHDGGYWGKPGEPHGPRLSRGYQVASNFIGYSMPWCAIGGVLVLNEDALRVAYELVEYRDRGFDGSDMGEESEVAVLAPRIERLERFLASVQCSDEVIEQALDPGMMLDAQNEGGWPNRYGKGEDGIATAARALQVLQALPSRNLLELPTPSSEWGEPLRLAVTPG